MSDDITVDVEVEGEVDSDELEIERDDAEVIEATYEANGIEIEVEADVETDGASHRDTESETDGGPVTRDPSSVTALPRRRTDAFRAF